MKKIVIYGKGGIGKSMVSSHISVAYAQQGYRVLQVGCDPKHDSCKRLLYQDKVPENFTVIDKVKEKDVEDITKNDITYEGKYGIDCIEAGGPFAGLGCAGRGISLMFDIFENIGILDDSYDVIIFDVLGDVVCGGFASPLKIGFADNIYLVISEEIMALYAANNLARAVVNYKENGIGLGGLILNRKNNNGNISHVQEFSKYLNTEIIGTIERNEEINKAEKDGKTLFEHNENSDFLSNFYDLSKSIYNNKNLSVPNTFNDEEFDDFVLNFIN